MCSSCNWPVLLLLALSSCHWHYANSQQSCTVDQINHTINNLWCDTVKYVTEDELFIDCSGSTYVVSHNISRQENHISIESFSLGVVCGSNCAEIMYLENDYRRFTDNATLIGQLNVTNATECYVTGCYQIGINSMKKPWFRFSTESCELGLQSLETTAPEATATVEPEATTPEISSTAGDTKTEEVTTAIPDGATQSMSTVTMSIILSITVFVMILSVVSAVIIGLSVKHRRVKDTRLYAIANQKFEYFLKSDAMEVDTYDLVPIQLSKTISVSEPSLLFPLNQSTVAVHTTSTDSYVEELPDSDDGQLSTSSDDNSSQQSSESSPVLTEQIQLDHPGYYKGEGYCEMDEVCLKDNNIADNNDVLQLDDLMPEQHLSDNKYVEYGDSEADTGSGYILKEHDTH